MLSEKAVFVFKEEESEYYKKQWDKLMEIAKKIDEKDDYMGWIWDNDYDIVKMMLWNW